MEIIINGKKQSYTGTLTVHGLLQSLNIDPGAVVVERNLKIVARMEFEHEPVNEGDSIEIIHFVGGG